MILLAGLFFVWLWLWTDSDEVGALAVIIFAIGGVHFWLLVNG